MSNIVLLLSFQVKRGTGVCKSLNTIYIITYISLLKGILEV